MTSEVLPRESSSISATPRIRIEPRPVEYVSLMPCEPTIKPYVGKSGPLTYLGTALSVGFVVLQAPEHRLGELAQVVRRHVGRHADRDAARPVGQQVGEPAGQDGRL